MFLGKDFTKGKITQGNETDSQQDWKPAELKKSTS